MDRTIISKLIKRNNYKTNSSKSKSQKGIFFAIASIPLIMTLGNSMLIPILTTIEKKLKISSFQSSLIITVYSIVAIILIPIAGYLSDKFGRKKIIIPSLIIASIGGVVAGVASWMMDSGYIVILIGRVLQGIGAAGAAPIVLPLVADIFTDDSKSSQMLGVVETSNTLGKVLSPIIGSALAALVWFLPFFAFTFFCAISIVLLAIFIKVPEDNESEVTFKQFIVKIKSIFKEHGRWLIAIFAIGGILMFTLFGVLFFLSDTLEKVHDIKDIKKGLLLAIPLGALCIASYTTGKVIKENKVLMKWITFISLLLVVGSISAINFVENIYFILAIFFISGVGIGASLPCLDSLVTNGIEKEQRGTITSLYSAARFIGVAAGPPVIALLMKAENNIMFWGLAVLCAVCAFICLKAIRPSSQ